MGWYWLENWVVIRTNRMQIIRMHILNPNSSSHSGFELCDFLFTFFTHSLLWIVSVFLVHVAVALDGRKMHNHEIWVTVLQKEKSLFRGGDGHESTQYGLRCFVWHTILTSVTLKPSNPWNKYLGIFLCKREEGVQCLQEIISKIRRWYQWHLLKSRKILVCSRW